MTRKSVSVPAALSVPGRETGNQKEPFGLADTDGSRLRVIA